MKISRLHVSLNEVNSSRLTVCCSEHVQFGQPRESDDIDAINMDHVVGMDVNRICATILP